MEPKKLSVVIVGGGFGGIAAALELERHRLPGLKITLISDKSHFEYHPGLYHVVTGKSPLEVCVPIVEILKDKAIEFENDQIVDINFEKRIAVGSSGSHYSFEYLILALGAETAYFNIPGLKEFSFGFKSITEALKLKEHLHHLFEMAAKSETTPEMRLSLLHFVIVGAGPSGVELAGELVHYAKKLAEQHKVNDELIAVDLIEAAPRILPMFPHEVSVRIAARLRSLGVNIFVNRQMVKEDIEQISLRGMTMKTETVIWTAGVKPNSFFQKLVGLSFDPKGHVVVDDELRAKGVREVFVIGDGAATQFSGLAQTAIYDGRFVARNTIRACRGESQVSYQPHKPAYSVPVGRGWAATLFKSFIFYGMIGWVLRRLADLHYFLSILPLSKALTAFRSDRQLCESCDICASEESLHH